MQISKYDLSNWLKQKNYGDKVLFDNVLNILSEINNFIRKNNLSLVHEDDSVLLIQLIFFLYSNSKHQVFNTLVL